MSSRWPESYVLLTLLAALLFAAGNALQKQAIASRLGALSAPALVARHRRVLAALLRSPFWMLGLAITLAAFTVEIQALALGDVTVVKPLSRVQIAFVLAIGVGALGERLTRIEWLGVGLILAGAVFLAREPSAAGTGASSAETIFVVAASLGALVIASLWWSEGRLDGGHFEHAPALAAGVFFGLGDVLMKAATQATQTRTGEFSLMSADTLATFSVAPELILSLIATMLAFAIQQLAFSRSRVSIVVPLVGVAGTAVVVVLGATLLNEQLGGARLASTLVILAGSLLIGRAASHAANPGEARARSAH